MPESQHRFRLFVRGSAGFSETDEACRAEPHVAELALMAIPKNPALCPARTHPKVKAAAVTIEPRLRRLCDLDGREAMCLPSHNPRSRFHALSHTFKRGHRWRQVKGTANFSVKV